MALAADLIPVTVAGLLNLVLGVLLLTLNINHRANRAFAVVRTLRAGTHLHWALAAATEPATAAAVQRTALYLAFWLDCALLYFLAVYPHPRRWLPRSPWGALLFAGPAAAAALAFATGLVDLHAGSAPFRFVFVSASVVFGVAGLVLWRDADRMAPGLARTSTVLISAGFAIVSVQDIVGTAVGGALAPGAGPDLAVQVLVAFWALVLLALVAHLVVRSRHRVAFVYLAVLAATAALGFGAQVLLPGTMGPVGGTWGAGISRLLLPLLVFYALVRHQVFDLDIRFRRGFGKSLVPLAFVALFFLVSEGVEQVVSEAWGTAAGLVAAACLLLVLRPLERAADAFARRAVPGARDPAELSEEGREDVYRELARTAWQDGPPGPGERRVLEAARERLRLTADRSARIEAEVDVPVGHG